MDYDEETYDGDPVRFKELKSFLEKFPPSLRNHDVNLHKRKRVDETQEAADTMQANLIALSAAMSSDNVTLVQRILPEFDSMSLEEVHLGEFDFRDDVPRNPLLHYAARHGSLKVLRFLVEEIGLNIDKFTKEAGTPLTRSIHCGEVESVEYLLEAGCDVNIKVPVCQLRECRINNVTPLMIAVSRDEPEIVERLLGCGRCNLNATASRRETALYFAIKHPAYSLQYVEMLLTAGVLPNMKSTTEDPPLLLALKMKRYKIAKKLIAHACDVNATIESDASYGITALHLVVERDDVDLVQLIVQAGANLEAKMNPKSTLGSTPLLHCVAGNRAYKAMTVLLDAGSDVTALDKFGRNICHWLVLNGDDAPLSALLSRCGRAVDMEKPACDGNDTTPLDYATVTNNIRAAKILLSYNCKVRKVLKNESESPLEFAVKRGFSDLLPCLHQAGSDVSAQTANGLADDRGRTVGVHPALRYNSPMVDWLREVSFKPRSLLDLSRLSIRRSMSTDIVKDVTGLEIPRLLQQHVLAINTKIN